MKRSLLIFAALAAWTACAQSARLGSLGRNDMVVTNIGEIARAESYGTETQWTDATGCVWKVVDYGETWRVAYNSVGVEFVAIPVWREPPDEMVPGWYAYGIETGYQLASTNYNATLTDIKSYSGGIYDDVSGGMVYYEGDVSWMRGVQTIFAGRVAMTNEIPDVSGLSSAVDDLRIESALIYRLYSGSNVVAEVTNYNSHVHAPSLRLLQINESNEYVTVWTETNGLSRTLNSAKEYTDDATNALRDVYAPRGWSATTSGMGAEAPSNTTWISTPRTVIAGGLEYAKIVDASGEVWVLTSNGMAAEFNPNTNAYFRITADDGTEVFSIEKTDAQVVGANADGITVSESSVTIPVGVVSAEHPTMYWRTALDSGDWADESSPPTGATVTWTGSAGAWVCTTAWSGERPSSLFFKFTFVQEGSVVIKNNAQTDLSTGIIVNGTRFIPSVSGNNLIWTKQ